MQWQKICALNDIPKLGSRVVKSDQGNIAVFRTGTDKVLAVRDKCPHKGGPLSQGIVHGEQVTCPLHGLNICLNKGVAVAPDVGCVPTFPVKVENEVVYLQMQLEPA